MSRHKVSFSSHTAASRFGYGLSPSVGAPESLGQMLDLLRGPDRSAAAYPLPSFRVLQDALVLRRRFGKFARENPDSAKAEDAQTKARDILRDMRRDALGWFVAIQQRRIHTPDGFRERLVAFWADHFTVVGKGGLLRLAGPLYVEEAIRPQVIGSFADLLISVVTHPLMLHYLDQSASVGPNSRFAQRRNGARGLNENLAREVLELHTIGAGGPYQQADVLGLAKLFTGMTVSRDYTFKFRPALAEPGSKTLMGRAYGPKGGMEPIKAALRDLALHPATAAHLARKMVIHFISDDPPQQIVADVAAAYRASRGDLMACYEALLAHPLSWRTPSSNMRPPDEFISAALRALTPPDDRLTGLRRRDVLALFLNPLRLMGQPWLQPDGPDGFDEADGAWITPQGVSARLEWAMNAPARLMPTLPDPRDFVTTALGDDVPEAVRFAANAAEDRRAAIGLILASPAFQRR